MAKKFVLKHAIQTLLIFFVLSVVIVLVFTWQESIKINKLEALEHGKQLTQTLTEFRTLYTAKVVTKAKLFGMEITHDYQHKKNAIPLPATMSMELGVKIGLSGYETKSFLYSPYPFPWRKKGGLRDNFQRKAWKYLSDNKKKSFYSFEKYQDKYSLRYATADLMRSSCVNCHNTHSQSPKSNWRKGDLRGILEVVIPMGKVYDQTQKKLFMIFTLIVVMGGIGLSGLALFINRLYKSSAELELQVEQRTAEVNAGEYEKKNMGRELHDGLGQQLAGISFILTSLESKLATNTMETQLKKANQLLTKAIEQVQILAKGLYPIDIQMKGFLDCTTELVNQIEEIYNVKCEFKHDNKTNFAKVDEAIHVYRIVQEAIHNAIQHGKAKHICVELCIHKNVKVLTIEDNGLGITEPIDNKKGLGLHTMRYRAKTLGATFDICQNSEGSGTKIVCSIPEKIEKEKV